ncbi:hypothetical protein HPMBJEAJ_00371 [Aeromonas phage avDM6]|nr:hypothetical protein HPMBJEAJ_00371 [Aeromonas phage avDM6]
MKLITYVRKVFLNEIDVFGSKISKDSMNSSGIEFTYGFNKFMNELQRRASVVEFFEPTNLKCMLDHIDYEIKEYGDSDSLVANRWVIVFTRKENKPNGKMLDHIAEMGHAIEMITKSTSFEIGSVVSDGVIKKVAFIFHKE